MSNKKSENQETIADIQTAYSSAEKFLREKKNILIGVAVVLAAIIGAFFWYTKSYQPTLEKEAAVNMFKAEKYFQQDSLKLAIDGDGTNYGFKDIVAEYSGTKAANLANYYLGVCYMQQEKYQEAIDKFNDFHSDDIMLKPLSVGLIGDAYLQLNDEKTAADYYEKAAEINPNNITSPTFLFKAGNVYENLKNLKKAKELYIKIAADFKESAEARSIEKYIARVNAKM